MRDCFSTYHPVVNFVFFAEVLGFSMFLLHPVCLVISLLCGAGYALCLNGRKAVGLCLKGVLPMERICGLLRYVNGKLDDETDDIIDDCELYFLFLDLAARARDLDTAEEWEHAIAATLEHYIERAPGARDRVRQVLRIMLTGWAASRLALEADKMLTALERKEV